MTTRYLDLITELDLGSTDKVSQIVPLTGGVASDIVRVELDGRVFCLKCALEKLKVKEDWRAPLHRNRAEYAWLEVAATVDPNAAVSLLGRSEKQSCFAMEYVQGEHVYLWKAQLLKAKVSNKEAEAVGHTIGKIHNATSAPNFDQTNFKNHDDFYQLRLDPYLNFTATQHPEVSATLNRLVADLHKADQVLIHGDISPKNILFRDGNPIILDAECATMGDACFDLAFCLNHLILKAILLPAAQKEFLEAARILWHSYRPHICWENPMQLEQRICALLPALMLARVDGKSPVEYFDATKAQVVRAFSLMQLKNPVADQSLDHFLDSISDYLDPIQTHGDNDHHGEN